MFAIFQLMNTSTSYMTRRQMAEAFIDQQSLRPIIDKYGLVPQFDTWVSLSTTDGVIKPYPDCGVRFYLPDTDICVGMIHASTNTLLRSKKVVIAGGLNRYSIFPHQMSVCHTVDEFDESVAKIMEEHTVELVTSGKLKLFFVSLNHVEYDTYDSAVIAATDADTLRRLIDDEMGTVYSSSRIEYQQDFYLRSGQSIEGIQEIGHYNGDLPDGKIAKVICSSYNAG